MKSTSESATVMAQTTYVLSEETSKPGPSASPKHNQKKPKLKSKNAKAASVSRTEPVAMAELTRFIKTRKSGKINGFQQDFEVNILVVLGEKKVLILSLYVIDNNVIVSESIITH